MSRIFEALQHAEKERLRRRKAVEEQKNIPKRNVDRTLTVDMTDPHQCVEFAVRVGRKGPVDFLYRAGWDVSLANAAAVVGAFIAFSDNHPFETRFRYKASLPS